jgi:hypothetical protein
MTIDTDIWIRTTLVVHPNRKIVEPVNEHYLETDYRHYHALKVFDLPAWLWWKWSWYINYYRAIMQVRFPMNYISTHQTSYSKSTPAPEHLLKKEIASSKAQVSRVKNLIRRRERELSEDLFGHEHDAILEHLHVKLEEKEIKLKNKIMKL